MIKELLLELKLFGALEYYNNEYESGTKDSIEKTLKIMFTKEKSRRSNNALAKRLSYANFPYVREWEQIDLEKNKKIPFEIVKKNSSGDFISKKKNLCFIGTPGLGKTHSLVAIGRDLCRQGMSVKFYTACDLVNQLEEAKQALQLTKLMNKLMKPQLLIIDELGFVPFSETGSRLLFDVFSKRYETSSIGVSTNLTFNKWPAIFGSIELTTALIDRFTHNCNIYTYEGKSVRLGQSLEQKSNSCT
jgi:DNA replication protein DnaC